MSVTRKIIVILSMLFVVHFAIPVFAQEQPSLQVHLATDAAVPGSLLAPGDYIFRPLDPIGSPNTIEILRADDSQPVGYFRITPVERSNISQTDVALSSPDQAGVRLIQTLYIAGENVGYQFNYSKKDIRRADQLAQARALTSGSAAGQP